MKKLFQILFGAILFCTLFVQNAFAQVMDPNDPVVEYTGGNLQQPPWGQVADWVKTTRLNWNTDDYKAYIFEGQIFRLKFPKSYQHNVNDGKTYPLYIFFHGLGESGNQNLYDNEYQLFHGGQLHKDSVNSGAFDGFLLYMQNQYGFFGDAHFDAIADLINNFLVPQNKVDINRIMVNGLSGGGTASWDFTLRYPKLVAACLPISASQPVYGNSTSANILRFIPMWLFQGGRDNNPSPSTTRDVVNNLLNAGTNIRYTEYPNRGHSCWYDAWAEKDYFPFMLAAHKANPVALGRKHEFCPGETVNLTMGVTAGFDGYQWRKNGVVITGATSNTLTISGSQAATFGTYDCRIRRGTTWSVWSPQPLVVKLKDPTIPPDIKAADSTSNVIAAPDGRTSATMKEPSNYLSYAWYRVGNPSVLGTDSSFTTSTPGDYYVKVTEEFGCESENSSIFKVVDANGPNKPDKATNIIATALSLTQIKLDWSDNPIPGFNETTFEIYQSTAAGGPYKMVGITGQDTTTFTVNGLQQGVRYYYIIRAVNNSGAAPISDEISCSTIPDKQGPTAPGNLKVTATSGNSVSLGWNPSIDENPGQVKYEIYINGVKSYVTTATSFTCYNLVASTYYDFIVKAKDISGNLSLASNKVVGYTVPVGLTVNFYYPGTWTQLPDFSTLAPTTTGGVSNVDLASAGVPSSLDGFGVLWQGFITIPVDGTYTFRTTSDDGSKLWLNAYNFSTPALVSNDGDRSSAQTVDGTITLTAGAYPISIAYFNRTGTNTFSVQWRIPGSSNFVTIPSSSYRGIAPPLPSVASPTNLTANAVSYNRVNLSWTDNSNNETGFNVFRSLNPISGFSSIGVTSENSTSFVDSVGLNPSTTYYYRIVAVGDLSSSSILPEPQANWKFNNDYADAAVYTKQVVPVGSPVFNAAEKREGSHSLQFNGSNQYLDVATSSGDYLRGGYSQKSVTFWMQSASNTGNRMVFDLGGNDDGLAMRIDANTLIVGIASGNIRRNFSVPYNYASTAWNHIALVYNSNSLKLYINGTQVGANDDLGYASGSVGTTTNGSRIGANNSSNAFNVSSGLGLFAGRLDNFGIYDAALSTQDIVSIMNNTTPGANATTQALPAVPASPTNLLAKGISTSSINITWNDVAGTETKYELYRSGDDNSNYVLLATLPANSTSYTDNGLYASAVYYYKVLAVNFGGNSGYSNEDSASSFGYLPELTQIDNQYMRYNTQLQFNLQPVYTGNGTRTLTVTNLPSGGWATFTPNGDGTGVLSFNPSISNQGTYPNITITATDGSSGSTQVSFQLVVNDNYSPVIGNINNATLNENQTSQLNISATDQNGGDVLTWSFTDLPSFASITPNGNSVQLNLAPGYADNGTYNVTARVEDQNHGFNTKSFAITVNDVNPNRKTYINFTDGTYQAPAPWNNTNKQPSDNDGNFPGMKDETGATTTIGLQITSPWQNMGNGSNNLGVNTNSGIYPNAVIRSAYWSDVTQQNLQIYGLDVNSKYSFTFFGSRGGVNNNRTTNYTIKGTTVSLNAANNSQNTVSINNVQPDPGGTLTLSIKNGSGSTFAYINSLVIESVYDDGSAPAKPKNLSAQLINGQPVLNWNDVAYNETAYEVYRSTSPDGPFMLLTSGNNPNLEQYTDNGTSGNTTYYYAVRATNSYGNSPYTDTVSVSTGNGTPVLNTIADVKMKTQQIVNINLSTTDDAGDVITLTATGLPLFATLTDNGNGTGVIHVEPGNTTGNFNDITVTARDDKGASTSRQFNIAIADKDITSIYVNFNEVILPVDPYWNSTNGVGYAGKALNNLVDESVTPTGVNLTIVDAWEGANDLGVTTGNNTGVFPDNVMKTVYYESTTNVKRIRISGLSASNKYNLVFFASRSAADNRSTIYKIGTDSVTLNAANNTQNTVQINGLVPDINGAIEFTAKKAAGSSFAYLGALVIQSYVDNGTPLTPTNLTASAQSKTKIQLNWSDKSGNEDAFEIYRSNSYNGTYSLLKTTAANVTSYIDSNLNSNSVYYYKVRAKRAPFFFSAYSNIAGASPYTFSVYINFNRQNNASSPWNNTSRAPELNRVFSNLRNDLNNNTGLAMQITENFSGDNPSGMNTGNNSGVVPDNVMRSSWWVDYGLKSQLKISNLNHTWAYTFVFFASRDGDGDRTTIYTINGQSVSLNASFNTTQTVQIDNVRPDENGEVFIDVSLGQYAQYAYLNGMIIHGYQLSAGINDNVISSGGNNKVTGEKLTPNEISMKRDVLAESLITNAGVYPNPFTNQLKVAATFERAQENVTIKLLDMMGRTVYIKNVGSVDKGFWNYRLDLSNDKVMPSGMYLMQIFSSSTHQQPLIFKLMKTK